MRKLCQWLKNNLILTGALILLVLIPLYPKFPLLDISGTWVYIRLEDLIISAVILVFLFSEFKNKKFLKTPLTWPILVYWTVGLVSTVISIAFIGKSLANYFPHLTVLHYLRRIEYMILFFIGFRAATGKNKLPFFIWTLTVVGFLVFLYGLGQKLMGWPAFMTMNEEFAKGLALRLPPTARMPSTFGGHYDLAAFLVLIIPIFASLAISSNKIITKIIFSVSSLTSYILLLLTASRISFGVYLVAISLVFIWHRKYLWLPIVLVASFLLLNTVNSASERFYKTFRFSDVIVDLSTGQPIGTLSDLEGGTAFLESQEEPDKENLPKGSGFIGVSPPVSQKTTKTVEYYVSKALATGSGEIATVSGQFLIQKALVYDISITTRLQGQWPKAIQAFKRNILTGSGYSTLSVAADGDYFRSLGETGIIGTAALAGVFLYAFYFFGKLTKSLSGIDRGFVLGFFAGFSGLLLNAILIDVFEASKVAYVFWLLLGVAISRFKIKNLDNYLQFIVNTVQKPITHMVILIILIISIYGPAISTYFHGDDFTWIKWAAQSSFKDIPGYFSDSAGFFYRPVPKLVYFLEYTIFWLKPAFYRMVSLLIMCLITISVYLIMNSLKVKKYLSLLFALLFGVLAIHHENVIWISGQSSLLGAWFLFSGILFTLVLPDKFSIRSLFQIIFINMLILFSMMSYDGFIVGGLLIFLISIIYKKQPVFMISALLTTGLYWYIRQSAGAIFPTGDYGYNPDKLWLNISGNSLGYLMSILIGPKGIEFSDQLRLSVKSLPPIQLYSLLPVILMGSFGVLFFWYRKVSKNAVFWLILTFVSLISYLGLGGMAERYGIVASGFIVIFLSLSVNELFAKKRLYLAKFITVLAIVVLSLWNISEVNRIIPEWKFAGQVIEKSLLTMRSIYFPLTNDKTFVFVNTPIRYGRAWIFPTGMKDPLWHMFKFNGFSFEAVNANSLPQAYSLPPQVGNSDVLLFEDFQLKATQKLIKEVEMDSHE